jgi:signal transduction histidine kinase
MGRKSNRAGGNARLATRRKAQFRQVGSAEKKVEGTGLGLALSRTFIEVHGGRIWVASQLGQGAMFTFAVPVRRGESVAAAN